MRKNLILPKTQVAPDMQNGENLYFLAGPIRGGGDWQAEAVAVLNKKDPTCYIACPSRYIELGHPLAKFALPSMENPDITYASQTEWERFHMEAASNFGALIFWLACENQSNPRKTEDGPYARDSYGEIGRWGIRSAYTISSYSTHAFYVNVAFGIEPGFPGEKQIRVNLERDHASGGYLHQLNICTSLEQTIDHAVWLAQNHRTR